MCGICGVMSTTFISNKEFDVFKNLLYLSSFRGEDSTGVFSVEKKEQLGLNWNEVVTPSLKTLETSYDFLKRALNSKTKEPFFDTLYRKRVLVGHCRAATKGFINEKNIHPFEFDNVIGVHNGTIHPKFKHTDEYDTDSEALYRNINDYGITEALNTVAFPGTAYALVYYDKVAKTMNFIRNAARPLYFSYTDDYHFLMWASEAIFIEFAATRLGLKLLGWNGKTPDIFTLRENHLLTIPIDTGGTDLHFEKGKAVLEEVKIKPRPLPQTNHSGKTGKTVGPSHQHFKHLPWDDPDKYDDLLYPKKKYNTNKEKYGQKWTKKHGWQPIDQNGKVIEKGEQIENRRGDLVLTKRVFNNVYIPYLEFQDKLDAGCCICGNCENPQDKDIEAKIQWYDIDNYVCTDCLDNEMIRMAFENGDDIKTTVANLN